MEDGLLYCFQALDESFIEVCGGFFAIFCAWILVKKLLLKKKCDKESLIQEVAEELPKNALLGAGMAKKETEMIKDQVLKLLRYLKLKNEEGNGGSNGNNISEQEDNRVFGYQSEAKMCVYAVENMLRGLKIRFIAESKQRVVVVYRKAQAQEQQNPL